MTHSGRQHWLLAAVIAGALYLAVGFIFAELAGAAASNRTQFFWRLSAYIISGVVFAAHIVHEHFRHRNSARAVAWHASVGVALGGFALALVANIHDLGSASGYRPRMLIALVAWPLLTAVPAFIVGLLLAIALNSGSLGKTRSN